MLPITTRIFLTSSSRPRFVALALSIMSKIFTAEEVSRHNTEDDCWIIVNDQVLAVSEFMHEHPGGKRVIMKYAGKDASQEFNMIHQASVLTKYAPKLAVGVISSAVTGQASQGTTVFPAALQQYIQPASASKQASPTVSQSEHSSTAPPSQSNNTMSLLPLGTAVPGHEEGPLCGGTASCLPNERARATFDVKQLMHWLDGGEEKTERRQWIVSPLAKHDTSGRYHWSREENLFQHLKLFTEIHDPFLDAGYRPSREETVWMSDNSSLQGSLMNHYGLYLVTLMSQCNEEQMMEWLPRAYRMNIIGCYAQTELGHGSNVRGLQTVAVFDRQLKAFVLHTPTLRSIKWWPGSLGKVATHALVYAQLIIDGKEYGVHTFHVQLRDEHHRPLPGIELGDLGPKMGDHTNDTGFLRLDRIVVPLGAMLGKYQHVTEDGVYVKAEKKVNDKLHYATMMFTRGGMIRTSGGMLSRAATIAVRYSCVRTQGFAATDAPASFRNEELKIIDYQVQRARLLKQVAIAYVARTVGKWMVDRFEQLQGKLDEAEDLQELAATSAGLKGHCTFLAGQGIEECRKCCGGNGYLLNSGVGQLALDYLWQTTAEGDFVVMQLTAGKFLIKSLRKVLAGDRVSGPCEYMLAASRPDFSRETLVSNCELNQAVALTPDTVGMCSTFVANVALILVLDAHDDCSLAERDGLKGEAVWNRVAVQLVDAVKVHCSAFMLSSFLAAIQTAPSAPVRRTLSNIATVFACNVLLDAPVAAYLSSKSKRVTQHALETALDALRPDCVALVDAFDFPDSVLNSTIGRKDGNVYEALYEAAKKSSLNKEDPFVGYSQIWAPRLDTDFLQEGAVAHRSIGTHMTSKL